METVRRSVAAGAGRGRDDAWSIEDFYGTEINTV